MRFAATHKTTSYLAVGFAFLAMIGGGTVSPIVSLLGLVGLVASWWIEPPRVRVERWNWLFTVVAALGFLYSGAMAVGTGDYLGHGGTFLVILTVARASTRRAAKDWQQLYLLAFLMLVAGSVLNGELSYAVCFLGFVITSTWALMLFHLRREMEDNFLLKHADPKASQRVEIRRILESRRIVDRRFLVGTGLTALAFFVVAIVFFLAIPRVGVGFFYRGKGGQHMVGFSDGVKLGGHGRLKTDSTIVMRVVVSAPAFRGRQAPYLYWRGVAFDHYSRGEWTRTRRAPETRVFREDLGGNRERRFLAATTGHAIDRDDDLMDMYAVRTRSMRQEIWLEPLGTDVLFAASAPVAFELDQPLRGRGPLERNDEVRLRHDGPIHYLAWSQVERPLEHLRGASSEEPEGANGVYAQVPPEITERTRALAHEIVAGAISDHDKAVRLRDWLQANLAYTTDLRDPGGREPIDFFLFERKAGHCEYFASAFAIMARIVGLQTRSVNGFLGGEWNEYDGYIAVRAGDAHSWTEVHLGGTWVTFDATPPGEVDRLGRGGTGWRAKMGRWFDTLRFQWSKWVIDYDLFQQMSLFRSIGKKLKGGTGAVSGAGRAIERWAKRHWPWLVGGAAVLVAAFVWWRRRRRPRGDDAPRAVRSRERTELARLYERAARRLAPRPPSTTPRELARSLVEKDAPGATALDELTELYYAGQWGGAVSEDALARARVLAADIETAARRR